VLAGVSAAAAAGPGNSLQKHALQQQVRGVRVRTHRAVLDLFALDARLQSAQSSVTLLHAQAERLRGQQALLEQQLAAARRTLKLSQQQLELNLRLLYKQGDVSELAVVLGAQSLDEAVTTLDTLDNVAAESQEVVQATSTAQVRLVRLQNALLERRATLNAEVRAALRTTNTLMLARAERVSFITGLRGQERLKQAQLSSLQNAAARVERKSIELQVAAVPEVTPTATAPPALPPAGRTITVNSTGYSLSGRTATGIPVGWGVIAVDPSVIPLGTRVTVPGYGEGVAADTGSGVRGATIDLWFPSLAQARAWGRRTVTITLH
jgi:cystine transport system substrate-binding protein